MLVLGIETSCDETAASVVENGILIRSNVISSQIALHQQHGGVVPELAARAQLTAIMPVIEQALADAAVTLSDIDLIAFTQGPGLAGSLLVGVNTAKTLSYVRGIPMIGINHLEAHVYANWLQDSNETAQPGPTFPAICLLVSGGHTDLMLLHDHQTYESLGHTIDDAAGEAFDKGARLLGLDYPGGPAIQRAANAGRPDAYRFPRAWLGDSWNFSFSGLKTALLREVDLFRLPSSPRAASTLPFPKHFPPTFGDDAPIEDLAASYQQAIVDVLARKTALAARDKGVGSVLIAGGVAANALLRGRLRDELVLAFKDAVPPLLHWPELSLCTDNAAMIAGLGYQRYQAGYRTGLDADAYPRWPIGRFPPGQEP
ncbi:MAG: tRNA (adenosine(37)-N6)-threonylcarbamoyltransferase complex transferase subunit TsaD [Thermomicrobiales bacterium]